MTAPTGPNAAPPGYYMLFLLNDQGVPSVAKFVKLQQGGTLGGCGTPPPADLAPPTVSLTAPGPGKVAGTIDVKASASDDRGVVGVQLRRAATLLADDTSSPYEASWNTTTVPDGTYTLSATARDASGKTATASVTVTVENTDTDGPAVVITNPAAGANVTGVAPVTAAASDPSGVSQVQFRVDGANIGGPDTSAPFSIAWGSINVPNGSHSLTAVARDALGNERTSAGVSVNVNNQDGAPVDALPPKKPPQNTPNNPGGNNPGGNGPGGNGPGGTNAAPSFSRLRLTPATFRQGGLTTISFRLTEAAKVRVSFEQRLPGRRAAGRCVRPRKGTRPNCTRYVGLRPTMTINGKPGANTLSFRGKLSRTRKLAPGRYRVTLVATDSAGKRSRAARANLRLLERAPKGRASSATALALSWF